MRNLLPRIDNLYIFDVNACMRLRNLHIKFMSMQVVYIDRNEFSYVNQAVLN